MKRLVVLAAGMILVVGGVVLLWRGEAKPRRSPLTRQTTRGSSLAATQTSGPSSRELDKAANPYTATANPYAGALRQPGKSKRAWDPQFITQFQGAVSNTPIRFELTGGVVASGSIKITQYREGELTYVSGDITEPEPGKFFFLKPPEGGKAGTAAGVIEFEGSQTAYRIEPTGPNGEPELWQRRMDEVRCQTMPLIDPAWTNQAAEMPPLRPDLVLDYAPDYNSNIVSLQSYPGAAGVLLLDFFGGYTPTWGGVTYPRPNVSNAQIKDVWKRVAEDYMPFNINVTTDIRVYLNAPTSSRQKCVFSPSISAMPGGAAGVAYIGSWNWGSDTVCWSLYTSGKAGAEVGSHEAGHTVGLGHQGTSTSGYFGGHGSGATGWAPIMGAGYYQPVVSWAKGEYQDANNQEDELNILTTKNNNMAYRPDDTGNTLATARYLEVYPGNAASAEGVIERPGETDAFQFTTGGGVVSLTANPVGDWANLALSAALANANDVVIISNNPQNTLSATVAMNVPAGTYTLRVNGVGRNNPLTDGFTAYGSLGYYSVTGSVAAARLPTRLSVVEHAPYGTVVGIVPPTSTNSQFAFAITSGNTNSTFSIDGKGVVRVVNNALLDYDRLATDTMLPVQFELLVNIYDLSNPVLNELNRRVVVSVLNVNEPPVVTGVTTNVLEHTQPGTPIGTVTVRDPDFSETMSYSIVGGDPDGSFAVDGSGIISVAGDLDASKQNLYTLQVAANDSVIGNPLTATGYVRINVITNGTLLQAGCMSYAVYNNIGSGTAVTDLTGNARWPRDPDFEQQMPGSEGLVNRGDNYGAALRGYLIAPQSGVYNFYIASDDASELWLSGTTNSLGISRIAYVGGYTGYRQWTKYTTQQSSPVTLVAGQGYYFEARMKEGGGDDSLSVAWKGPATMNRTNIIPGMYLAPAYLNYVPRLTGFNATLHQDAFTGAAVGRFIVKDANAQETHSFVITGGNSAGLFTVDSTDGTVRVADQALLQGASPGAYTIQVRTTDSGMPPLGATANATITVVGPGALTATSIQREIWYNISGSAVSDLTNNAAFPRRPDALTSLSSFAFTTDIADNYGSRIRGFLTPVMSGSYRFFIASDDNSSLLLSANDDPAGAVRIAYVPGWTDVNKWTSYAQQMSAPVNLVAGQRYYIEALQKEGGGGDHVEVAWAGPGIVDANNLPATNIITGSFLTPIDLNFPPQINNQTLPVLSSIPNNTAVGRVAGTDSPFDTLSFQIIDGNTNNMFAIDPATGVISVLDNTLIAGSLVTSFPLTVAVQDSGCGGLYPVRSAQGTVTINVISSGSASLWTGAAGLNNWSDPGNWGGAVPADAAGLIFGLPWQQLNVNDRLATATWVQFTNGGWNVSGNPMQLQTGITNRGDNTWGLNTTLAAPQYWHNASGTFTAEGAITNNGFTLAIIANSEFRLNGPMVGSGGLTKSGPAKLLMEGTHPYTGNTIILGTGGTTTALEVNGTQDLDIRNSDLTLNGRMDLGSHDAIIGALNGSGAVFANDLTRTLTLGANDHSGNFAGVIQNAASGSGVTLNLVKTGAGTQILRAANSYSGVTAVMNGTLTIANALALGTTSGGTIVNAGATLSLLNNIQVAGEPLTLAGSGVGESGALRNDSGANGFTGPISLGGDTTIRAANGTLTLGGQWNTFGNTGTLTFDTGAGTTILVSSGINGRGSLVKNGPGLLVLNGRNTCFGATFINAGQLRLGAGGALDGSPSITLAGGAMDVTLVSGGWILQANQSLQGAGTVNGSAILKGSLVPASGATIAFSGDVVLAGSSVMQIARSAGSLTNNSIACSGTLTPGGTLTVTDAGTEPLAAGDSLRLFSAPGFGAGSFGLLNLPALPSTLMWNTSRLAVDGSISVELAAPPQLGLAPSASSFTLSWPAEYSGYVLEGQTNPPGQGVTTNWYPVPGVSGNSLQIPIDPTAGSTWYRLTRPLP